MGQSKLEIKNLHVSIEGKEIVKGLDLEVKTGEIHAIMGPNGSGKSTLAYSLMGHPRYEVDEGFVELDGTDILELEPDERSRAGLFLAFQYPMEVAGVTVANFLRTAVNSHLGQGNEMSVMDFAKKLREKMELLEMDPAFANRYLNEGFSGGEKKRNEILQLAMLEPKFAIMDETDSGLDIDALQIVSNGVNAIKGPNMGVVVITHYSRILRYLQPDYVHILMDGKIVRSGGKDLAEALEEKGYDWIREEVESGRA